jgi:hypothetical protein
MYYKIPSYIYKYMQKRMSPKEAQNTTKLEYYHREMSVRGGSEDGDEVRGYLRKDV